jgi:hypothetical protein
MDRCVSPMGTWEIVVEGEINRDKLRKALRTLGDEAIFYMLYGVVELRPPDKLVELVKPYIDPESLRPDANQPKSLLATLKSFEQASLPGEYYEDFRVDSTNHMTKSRGTIAWIAECNRLLDLCVAATCAADAFELRQCFAIVFGLLDEIDACRDDIIFLADEAGSWQVRVEWEKVLPSWFTVLSATAMPEEYAMEVLGLLRRHCNYAASTILQ